MLGEGSANRLQTAISVPCDCNHHKRSARSPAFGDDGVEFIVTLTVINCEARCAAWPAM
jgi:hypothetical protein